MSEWKPDEKRVKTVGPFTVVYLRPGRGMGSEGGHEVRFPTGLRVRVLPDGHSTSQKRSAVILRALQQHHECNLPVDDDDGGVVSIDPVAYLVGTLELAGLTWQLLEPQPVAPKGIFDLLERELGSRPADITVGGVTYTEDEGGSER